MKLSALPHARALAALVLTLTSLAIAGTAQAAGENCSGTVLADNPVAYWRLGEPTGLPAADSGSLHYDAQYVGTSPDAGALYTDSNGAAYLDGASEIVSSQDWSWL